MQREVSDERTVEVSEVRSALAKEREDLPAVVGIVENQSVGELHLAHEPADWDVRTQQAQVNLKE